MIIRKVTTSFFLIITMSLMAAHFYASAQSQITPLPTTTAQGAPAAKSVIWACLASAKYNPLTDTPIGVRPGGKSVRLMKASGSGFPTDTCVYVVGCINTKDNIECTTGDSNLDKSADLNLVDPKTGEANAIRLKRTLLFTFIVDGGAKKCNLTDGKLETVVHSESGPETIHTVWAVYPTKVDTSINDNSGEAHTLKLGTFGFQGGPGACGGERWDPWGVVFDSQSLEPLPQTGVTLLDTSGTKVSLPGLQNPVSTKADGLFNFLPEPGSYKLNAAFGSYTFSAFPKINANYTKAYADLYKPEDIIVEKAGSEEHRDIPLDPGTQTPYKAAPSHMSYGVVQTGTTLRVSGKQSHPLTVVTFLQNGVEMGKTTADKYGYYSQVFENSTVKADAPIEVFFTKTDLTAGTIQQPVKAYEASPIPPYLQGRALGINGTALSRAQVTIKLDMNNATYARTTADQDGVFKFDPRDIPPLSYHLEYAPVSHGTIVKKTVVEFARENKDYLAQNHIDLMVVNNTAGEVSPTPEVIETAPQAIGSPGFILAILVLLLIVLLVAAFVYTKRLHLSDAPNPTPESPEKPETL